MHLRRDGRSVSSACPAPASRELSSSALVSPGFTAASPCTTAVLQGKMTPGSVAGLGHGAIGHVTMVAAVRPAHRRRLQMLGSDVPHANRVCIVSSDREAGLYEVDQLTRARSGTGAGPAGSEAPAPVVPCVRTTLRARPLHALPHVFFPPSTSTQTTPSNCCLGFFSIDPDGTISCLRSDGAARVSASLGQPIQTCAIARLKCPDFWRVRGHTFGEELYHPSKPRPAAPVETLPCFVVVTLDGRVGIVPDVDTQFQWLQPPYDHQWPQWQR